MANMYSCALTATQLFGEGGGLNFCVRSTLNTGKGGERGSPCQIFAGFLFVCFFRLFYPSELGGGTVAG